MNNNVFRYCCSLAIRRFQSLTLPLPPKLERCINFVGVKVRLEFIHIPLFEGHPLWQCSYTHLIMHVPLHDNLLHRQKRSKGATLTSYSSSDIDKIHTNRFL